MRQVVTKDAPHASAMMSQAIVSGDTVYVAGQIHADLEWKLVGETVAEKVEQIMKNISAILEAANSSLENVIKVVIYLTDMDQLKELNEVYPKYFTEPYPVREAVIVSALPLGASIEISVIAER